jgi:hypothetical protein
VDHKVSKVLAAIIEAKAEKSMDSSKAWAQVAAQGAALCVLTFVSHDIDVKSYYPFSDTNAANGRPLSTR